MTLHQAFPVDATNVPPITDLSLSSRPERVDDGPDLEVRVQVVENGHLVVGLHGELDENTAPLLDVVLSAVAQHRRQRKTPGIVTFDLADVRFIYMRGIAALQRLCMHLTTAGWSISLVNESPNVSDLLTIARQHDSLMLTGPAVAPSSSPRP